MRNVRMGWTAWAALFACLISTGVFAQDEEQPQPMEGANPLGLSMTRLHAQTFEPGKPIEVTVTISAAAAGEITAMGLREVVPPEWRLQSVTAAGGVPPDVVPAPGATNTFEFAWVKVPRLPYTFNYVVTTPETDGGDKAILGTLEYRQMDVAHNAGPFMSELRGPGAKLAIIALKGGNTVTLKVGDKWEEPGYSALDGQSQDITGKVAVSGTVDTGVAGQYLLTYSVEAEDGQRASATRTVLVKEDPNKTTPPPISDSAGAAPPPEPGASGRDLSNPIAASTGTNPANGAQAATPPTTDKNEGEAGGAIKKPELPDTSALRPPAAPQPGEEPATQPDGTGPASDATAVPAATVPAAAVPPTQHRAPVPAKMLESTALQETAAPKAGKDVAPPSSSFSSATITLKRHLKSVLSAIPGVSPKVIACVAVALALLGALAFLGWRLVYSRPVVRKRPPSPPKR